MGFLWCPFCRNPHLLSEQTCPITNRPLPNPMKQSVQIGSLIENKYLLKTRLGSGAYGVVYAAENVSLGGSVALKFLGKHSRDAAARFEQEARIANGIQHPNICRVFDMGSTGSGTPYFVMELLVGATLRARMRRGRLDPHEAGGIMTQILSGLGAAHAKGVIHRDVKPENVFLSEREGLEPVAKILDFGLAKLHLVPSRGMQPQINTAKGVALGTVLYMSPEQLQGEPVSAQSDVFASAIVLHEAIAGTHPFKGSSHVETAKRILRDPPAPLAASGTPSRKLSDVIVKALSRDPGARYESARAFQMALHEALEIIERAPLPAPQSLRIPNLATMDSEITDEPTKTIPNAIYYKR